MIIDQESGIYQAAMYLATYVAGVRALPESQRSVGQRNVIKMWGEVADCVERELRIFREIAEDNVDGLQKATKEQLLALVRVRTEQRDYNGAAWQGADCAAAAMRCERDEERRKVAALEAALKIVRRERDDARANARILAHAYTHDSRPPQHAVNDSLEYQTLKPE